MSTAMRGLRPFVSHVVNPLMRRIAGKPWSPVALVIHKGRKSGKTYETPILVERTKSGFVLALTYGPKVDWLRNLIANDGGTIRWHGIDYPISKPRRLDTEKALQKFFAVGRPILRLNGTDHFVGVRFKEDNSSP